MKFHSKNNIPIKVLDNTLFSKQLIRNNLKKKRISKRVNIYIYASIINKQLEIIKDVYMLIIVLEICVCFVYSYQ